MVSLIESGGTIGGDKTVNDELWTRTGITRTNIDEHYEICILRKEDNIENNE
jgi:hypothetical protein